jgi:hypothetical protein
LEGSEEEDVFSGFGESDAGEGKLKHFVMFLLQMRLYVLSLLDRMLYYSFLNVLSLPDFNFQ